MELSALILSGLVANVLFAGPRRFYALFGLTRLTGIPARLVRALQRKLDREQRSEAERELRGTLCVGLVFVVCLATGLMLAVFHQPFLELFCLAVFLPVRPLWERGYLLYRQLKKERIAEARGALDPVVWRYHALLDGQGLVRAGIESLAVCFAEKIVAPAFWYALAGLPGLFFSRALFTMVEVLQGPRDAGFSKTAQQLCQLMHAVPVRVAACLWLCAGYFSPSARQREVSWSILSQWTSGSALMLEVSAAVLGLALGGASSPYAAGQWYGKGGAPAMPGELGKALFLFVLSHLLLFVGLGLFF